MTMLMMIGTMIMPMIMITITMLMLIGTDEGKLARPRCSSSRLESQTGGIKVCDLTQFLTMSIGEHQPFAVLSCQSPLPLATMRSAWPWWNRAPPTISTSTSALRSHLKQCQVPPPPPPRPPPPCRQPPRCRPT